MTLNRQASIQQGEQGLCLVRCVLVEAGGLWLRHGRGEVHRTGTPGAMNGRSRATVGFARFFLYDFLDEWLHWGNIFPGCFPQHLMVDSEVLMDELVSHPGHLLPRNFWMSLTYGGRDFLRGLSNNLERSDHGIDGLLSCEN